MPLLILILVSSRLPLAGSCSARAMVTFLLLPLSRTGSPLKRLSSDSFFAVMKTLVLSSVVDSSTVSLFGAFLALRMAVA